MKRGTCESTGSAGWTHAGARIAFKETRKMGGHSLSIVRDQNSSGLGGEPQHRGIRGANHATRASVPEINRRLPAAKSKDNSLIEIFVRLKT
jgi:hypothetical protein